MGMPDRGERARASSGSACPRASQYRGAGEGGQRLHVGRELGSLGPVACEVHDHYGWMVWKPGFHEQMGS